MWFASTMSSLGVLIQGVGAAWLMVMLGTSAGMVALVQAAGTLPFMLLSLPAGAIADTGDRRIVMLVAQLSMLSGSAIFAGLAWAGLVSPWLLLAFTFWLACGAALNGPAWFASVGDMVPAEDLPSAIALNSVGFNLTRSVGPALGGAIVAAAGAAATFTLNAVAYVGSVLVLWRWRGAIRPTALPPEKLGEAMAAGLRYAALSPGLLSTLARSGLFGMGAAGLPALLPVLVLQAASGGALQYGLILSAFGMGAVGAGLARGRLARTLSAERFVALACLSSGLGAAICAIAPVAWLIMPGAACAGAGWVLAFSSFTLTVQTTAPRWVEARAVALYQTAAFAGLAAGSGLWGAMADRAGSHAALAASGALLLVCAFTGRWLPIPSGDSQGRAEPQLAFEPPAKLDIRMRSGPVRISIVYRIDESDLARFLGILAQVCRIRRRDGARRWSLSRDLDDPSLWTESFVHPTWLDYLRHRQRRTATDSRLLDEADALDRNAAPVVRREIERHPLEVLRPGDRSKSELRPAQPF